MTQSHPQPAAEGVPPWLVDFLAAPPLWAQAALFLAAAVVLLLVARAVTGRDFYISLEEQRAVLLIVATVEGVAVAVLAALHLVGLGFAGTVMSGLVAGFAAVEILRRCEWAVERVLADEGARIAAAWLAVAVGALTLPSLASGGAPYPYGLDVAIGGVAVAMLAWLVIQEHSPGETVGDALRAE